MDRAHHLGEPVMAWRVGRATVADRDDWFVLRDVMWPQERDVQFQEIDEILARTDHAGFLARDAAGRAVGFAEVSLRHDYVEDCETSPVGFLEGIYVAPDARRQGAAKALVDQVAAWTRMQGCSELASDARIDNLVSHQMHAALGFAETARVVFFKRMLPE
jgi:aminoglycoside 6'-N-acetyltransferase I